MIEVPFAYPTVAPESDQEQEAYDRIDEMLSTGQISQAIGWAIKQRQTFLDGMEEVKELRSIIRSSVKGRAATNWAVLLFFCETGEYGGVTMQCTYHEVYYMYCHVCLFC